VLGARGPGRLRPRRHHPATVLLVATVALSTAATAGVGALAFQHLVDFPGSDPQVLLIGSSCWWRWGSTATSS
jgi:hypothetical protein